MKISPSGRFAVNKKNMHILYVSSDEPPHAWLRKRDDLKPLRVKDKTLTPFEYFDTMYINDCLKFAESMTTGVKNYQKLKCALREKGSRFKFGYKDEINITLAKGESPSKKKPALLPNILNESANPEIGESYAIVRARELSSEIEEVPYHIAFVLAKDGDTNITIEADAGSDIDKPVFDMYSPRDTFHNRYKEMYAPASTIILERV